MRKTAITLTLLLTLAAGTPAAQTPGPAAAPPGGTTSAPAPTPAAAAATPATPAATPAAATPAAATATPAATPTPAVELPPTVNLPPELARVLTDYEAAWRAKDAAALARLFAEDGFVLSGGRPPVRGRAAIERHYAGQGGMLLLRAFAWGADGGVGYILGGFAVAAGEPDIGKFTLTLQKGADGRWLIMSDMDNANQVRR